jgi:ATP-dependent RNA helicase DDX56/DBP9
MGEGGVHFHDLGLDDRLLKAVAKLGWARPTLIQEKAIPLVLEGKDVLLRAGTGSGKTAVYALPLLQKILTSKSGGSSEATVRGVVLVPSKELSSQATKNLKASPPTDLLTLPHLLVVQYNPAKMWHIHTEATVTVTLFILCFLIVLFT